MDGERKTIIFKRKCEFRRRINLLYLKINMIFEKQSGHGEKNFGAVGNIAEVIGKNRYAVSLIRNGRAFLSLKIKYVE